MNDYKFGNFICQLREEKGLTQAALAEMLGVTSAAVSKWENGDSKPRMDTLKKLAEIFSLRVDELLMGERVSEEETDEKTVAEIYRRYEHIRREEMYSDANAKFRRCAAFLIDALIAFAVFFIIFGGTVVSVIQNGGATTGSNIVMMYAAELLPVLLMMLRDTIGGGRSVGKRALGLVVIDRYSGEPIKSSWTTILRDLLFIICSIDLIVLLIEGRTVGDMLAKTVVVKKSDYEAETCTDVKTMTQRINGYEPKKKKSARTIVIIIICVFAVAFAILMIKAFTEFSHLTETEQYYAAIAELEENGIDTENIALQEYSHQKSTAMETASFTFATEYGNIYVQCTKNNGEWVAEILSYMKP